MGIGKVTFINGYSEYCTQTKLCNVHTLLPLLSIFVAE